MAKEKKATSKAAGTVGRQRAIQQRVDAREKPKGAQEKAKKKPVQAGTRKQPENPLPPQHLRKPGNEHELSPRPRYLAPDYRGSPLGPGPVRGHAYGTDWPAADRAAVVAYLQTL